MYGVGFLTLRAFIEAGDSMGWYRSSLRPELFRGTEKEAFEWVQAHITKHHKLPHLETFQAQFLDAKQLEPKEPPSYYLDHLVKRYEYDTMSDSLKSVQEILTENKENTGPAIEVMRDALQSIALNQKRTNLLNLASPEGLQLLSGEYYSQDGAVVKAEFGWDYLDAMAGGLTGGDVASFVGRPQQGKASPLDAKVLARHGWTTMGALKVGDELASVDGLPSQVKAIYPQGKRPVYRLNFADGRNAETSDEHLWEVHYREWDAPRVVTTLKLIDMLKVKRYQRRLSVRLFSGDYGQEKNLMIPPYLLGVLLGDGCFRASYVGITSADDEILDSIRPDLSSLGCSLVYKSRYDYRVVCNSTSNSLVAHLRSCGLWGLRSEDKFIPVDYLHGTREQRLAVLQGLMDTDGTAEKSGAVTFCSSSKRLAEQVQYLVLSLGGRARIRVKKTDCLDAYIVALLMPDRAEVFRLQRKRNRVSAPRRNPDLKLTLWSIDYVGERECQCIEVSHPDHLYVTDDFIVTHNTFKMLYSALHNWYKKRPILFASMEMGRLPIAQRVSAMHTHLPLNLIKTKGLPNFGPYNAEGKFFNKMTQFALADTPFYVIDGNLALYTDELYALAAMLGVHAVYIDGGYLMKHRNPRLDRYTKVAENVEAMKQNSADLGIPTIASWQFNRSSVKNKKPGERAGLEDIGYSDAIPQISSVVLGLFQEDGAVDSVTKKLVDVLKGRNGEVGQFEINWDFNKMDFSQIGTQADESKEHPADVDPDAFDAV